jgi:hypothetical protein
VISSGVSTCLRSGECSLHANGKIQGGFAEAIENRTLRRALGEQRAAEGERGVQDIGRLS